MFWDCIKTRAARTHRCIQGQDRAQQWGYGWVSISLPQQTDWDGGDVMLQASSFNSHDVHPHTHAHMRAHECLKPSFWRWGRIKSRFLYSMPLSHLRVCVCLCACVCVCGCCCCCASLCTVVVLQSLGTFIMCSTSHALFHPQASGCHFKITTSGYFREHTQFMPRESIFLLPHSLSLSLYSRFSGGSGSVAFSPKISYRKYLFFLWE